MRDQHGAIFIDRDSTHFRLILNFLRSGLNVTEMIQHIQLLDEAACKEIHKELDFYGLRFAHFDCHWTLQQLEPNQRCSTLTLKCPSPSYLYGRAYIRAHGTGLCTIKVISQSTPDLTFGFCTKSNVDIGFVKGRSATFTIDTEKKKLSINDKPWPTTADSCESIQVFARYSISSGRSISITICD